MFCAIAGSGRDWNSKTAVLFTTYLLEEGVTKCLIGTRGLSARLGQYCAKYLN